MKLRIIHHSKDCDGIMSATLAKMVFVDRKNNQYVKQHRWVVPEFYPYNYETDAEWMHDFNPEETFFIFIDITPTLDWVRSCPAKTVITIFDHHKLKWSDIMEEAHHNKNVFINYYFSESKCGSKIFYDYIKEEITQGKSFSEVFGVSKVFETKLEYLVGIVDEYDIWSFATNPDKQHRETVRQINAFLSESICELSFERVINNYSTTEMSRTGFEILRAKLPDNILTINNSCFDTENKRALFMGKTTYELQSTIQELASKDQWGPMLLMFCEEDMEKDEVSISLRSAIPNTFDCAKEARKLVPTGGGHYEAAGCKMSIKDFSVFRAEFIENIRLDQNRFFDNVKYRDQLQNKFTKDWIYE